MFQNCAICGSFAGRQSVCVDCAVMIWPNRRVNPGAKVLATKLMPVPDPVLAGPRG